MTAAPAVKGDPIPHTTRNRTNRLFLYLCLCITSLSVLALAVLLLAIFLQGTKHLLGFLVTVLPHTDSLVDAEINFERRQVRLLYERVRPERVDLPESVDPATSTLEVRDGMLVAVPSAPGAGEPIEVTAAVSLVDFNLPEDSRTVELAFRTRETRTVGIPDSRPLVAEPDEEDGDDGQDNAADDETVDNANNRAGGDDARRASVEITDDQRVVLTFPDGSRRVVASAASPLERLAVLGEFEPSMAGEFLAGRPSTNPSDAGFKAPLIGSIWLLAVCAAVALPLGVGTAVFLEEFRPRRRSLRIVHKLVETNIRNLAGVPSVVYGLIGLTVFVRLFGLFGSQLDYQPYTKYELNDGASVVGIEIAQQDEAYRLSSDAFGDFVIERGRYPDLRITPAAGADVPITGTYQLTDDFEFIVESDTLGRLELSPFDSTQPELLGAEPFAPRPFEGALALEGESRYVVETVTDGRVSVPRSELLDIPDRLTEQLADDNLDAAERERLQTRIDRLVSAQLKQRIDRVSIRRHTVTLDDGTVLRGKILSLDDGAISLQTSPSEPPVEFSADDIARAPDGDLRYRAQKMITFLDEDHPLHIRLPFGSSVLAAGLTLMLVILPVVIIASSEAIRAVPYTLREGALALGTTRWQMVWKMTLPNAVPGIMTGSILAMSRAIGEAAPILVIGGAAFISFVPDNLMAGFAAMPLQIYNWTSVPNKEFQLVAASGIIILLCVLLVFNATAVFIRQKLQKPLQ